MAPVRNLSSFDSTLSSAKTTMVFSETLQIAVDSFKASKVRFLLTMLGMVIGSASIILVVTLGLTGKQYALGLIESIGPGMVEMQYGGGTTPGPNNTATPDNMTRDDEGAVRERVPGIVASSPMAEDHENIGIGGGITQDVMLLGVSPQYKDVRNYAILAGRFFDDEDATQHAKVVVVVKPLARELFGSPDNAIGQRITIRGIPFTVIGVFAERVDTFGQSEISDRTMLLPYPVLRYITGTDIVKEIFFRMQNAAEVPEAAERIKAVIQERHRPTTVFKAMIMTGVLKIMGQIADMLTLVLTLAAAITLVVSGVGIMNSMLANVSARTREIGIRKALGATKREIRLQFLTEAVILSLSGGIVGTIIGTAVPVTVQLLTPFKLPVSYLSVVIALATSVLVGVAFGTLPANRAASLNPVETLKYE